jgi:hypothetical protein
LDDDRPGYAQLAFDSPLNQPTLAISVRSQHEGAYLGPDGTWQKSAHFFTAARIGGDAGSALYRVGPEIVNHVLDLDQVEFATRDGSFCVETTWENAIPQLGVRQKGHFAYREAPPGSAPIGAFPTRSMSARESEPPASPPQPPPPLTETPPPALTETPPPPPIFKTTETASGKEIAPEEAYEPPDELDQVPPRSDGLVELLAHHRVYWLAALGVVGLVVLGFGLYQFLPCDWFGASHCVLPGDAKAEEGALRIARQCAADNARKCALPGCYAAYLHTFGLSGVYKDAAQSEAVRLDQSCLDEEAILESARDCAADTAQKCVQPGCYADYLRKYGLSGVHKNEARSEASNLDANCARATQAESPVDGGMPVAIGDTYEKVKRAYGSLKTPSEYCEGGNSGTGTGTASCSKKQLRLEDRGIWFFFDAQGKIYTMRFDPPWAGSVSGIKIGDTKPMVERQLGVPNGRDGPSVGVGPYYYNGTYVYRKAGKFIAVFAFDSSGRVVRIFI